MTIVERFDPRNNALNAIRLVLATLVIVSHAWPISGADNEPGFGGTSLGGIAVGGFFAISGFLITGSAQRLPAGRYAWKRFARIFPGFWICLLVTAFAIAPVGAWLLANPWTASGALRYVATWVPMMFTPSGLVGDTLAGAPFPSWNGSLWTLRHEVACYVLIGAAALIPGLLRRTWLVAAVFAALSAVVAVAPYQTALWRLFASLAVFFLAGTLMHLLRDRLPLNVLGASVALAFLVPAVVFGKWESLAAGPVAYLLVWLSAAAPGWIRRVGSTNDLSYGVYLYGFPVTQLLVAVDVDAFGPGWLALAATAATAPFAAASWWLVERPSMRLRAGRLRAPLPAAPVPQTG